MTYASMSLTILLNMFTVYVFYLFLLVAAHLFKPPPAKSPVPPLVIRGHQEALVTGDQQRECRENR